MRLQTATASLSRVHVSIVVMALVLQVLFYSLTLP